MTAIGSAPCLAADTNVPGPRQPLTTHDFGLYGGWNSYFLQPDNGFNFLIMQAWVPTDLKLLNGPIESHGQAANVKWSESLLAARRAGKRVIADVVLGFKKKDFTTEMLKRQLDYFMSHVDTKQLYAITLAEENVYWDGDEAQLIELYQYAKSKYDVPVYQWYSPYAGAPGFGWPALPADGWMLDEYAHLMPSYEQFIREYKIARLPLVSIVWAAPSMKVFPWKGQGDLALEQQWAVHNKYGIPSSFFCWSGKGNIWSWNPEASELDRQVFAGIQQNIKRFTQQPVPVNPADWDQPQPSAVPLTCQLQPTATFEEDYLKNGGHLVRSAGLIGFRHLRYRGKGVEFAPDSPGEAHSAIIYKLRHSFAPKTFSLRVSASPVAGAKATLTLSASADGKQWSSPTGLNKQGVATMALTANDPALQGIETWVRIDLKGQAAQADPNLLTINSLNARSTFAPTTPSPIQLKVADGKVGYETDFGDLSWLHTARITNADALILRPGALGLSGRPGSKRTVSMVQAFAVDKPVALQSLSIKAQANQTDLGATIRLGVSLDGKKPAVQTQTSGRFNKSLVLDSKMLQSLGTAKEFYVHLKWVNVAGVKTAPAWVKGLKIEARAQ
jgi:hypothetical protein